jgi:hypothetical protein
MVTMGPGCWKGGRKDLVPCVACPRVLLVLAHGCKSHLEGKTSYRSDKFSVSREIKVCVAYSSKDDSRAGDTRCGE